MTYKREPFFCPGCDHRASLVLTKRYVDAADERECPECNCIMCIDYGPWLSGDHDGTAIMSNGIPFETYGPRPDPKDPANMLDADYTHDYYDYSTDDLNDFEYQQDLYS